MIVEQRLDGAQVMRHASGCQKLLVASPHPAEVVIVCRLRDVVSVKRHWSDAKIRTEPCCCAGPCSSSRVDRFLPSLYRVGPTLWDERVMIVSDQAWGSLQQTMLSLHLDHSDIHGITAILRRVGGKVNGRTTLAAQSRVKSVPASFDLLAAMRRSLGISADFFGDHDGASYDSKTQVPARTREDKPHLPLGRKQG